MHQNDAPAFLCILIGYADFLRLVPDAAFKLHNHYPEQLSGKDLPQKRTCGNRKQREKSYLAVVAIKQCARRNADCNCTESVSAAAVANRFPLILTSLNKS